MALTKEMSELLGSAEVDLSTLDRPRLEQLCNALLGGFMTIWPTLEEETGQAALIKQQAKTIELLSRQFDEMSKAASRLAQRTTLDAAVQAAEGARDEALGDHMVAQASLTQILMVAQETIAESEKHDDPTIDATEMHSSLDQIASLCEEALGIEPEAAESEPIEAHLPYCGAPSDVDPADCPVCSNIPPDKRAEIIAEYEAQEDVDEPDEEPEPGPELGLSTDLAEDEGDELEEAEAAGSEA